MAAMHSYRWIIKLFLRKKRKKEICIAPRERWIWDLDFVDFLFFFLFF